MCMIAHRPTGKSGKSGSNMPNAVIDTALGRHPDGFGLAWREDGKVHVSKFGPKDSHKFRKLLKRVDKRKDIEYVAHFRMATHGIPCEELAHPFSYEDAEEGTVHVFHNGIVNVSVDKDGLESDTSIFVEQCLAPLPTGWWRYPGLRALVDLAGGWSKFVLMTDEETINLNMGDGNWDNGIWYSSDHKPGYSYATASWSGKGQGTAKYEYLDEDGWERELDKQYEAAASGGYGSKWKPESDDALLMLGAPKVLDYSRYQDTASVHDKTWFHGGHRLDIVMDIDRTKDGEFMDSVLCAQCFTIGDVYIVDGKAYIDLAHQFETEEAYS